MLKTNVRYILLCALRDRLFTGLLLAVVIAALLSAVLGSTAFLEEQEMTLVFAAETARFILMIGLIVFVCFHVRNTFDTKEIDVMLSRPLSRAQLVFDHWCGFALVGLFLVLPTMGVIAFIGALDWDGYAWWSLSLLLESLLVVAMALFAALVLKSAVSSVISTLGFYMLARVMVYFVMTSDAVILNGKYAFLKFLLKLTSVVMPRLDLFTKSDWLVYGLKASHDWWLILAQGTIYIPILIFASIIDFRRKQF